MPFQAFRLQMSIDGDVADVALVRLRGSLEDLTDFWRRYAAPKLYRDIADNFDSEGGGVGGWAPLSEDYAAWKAKHFPGRPILVRTGALKESLTFDGTSPGPEGIFDAGKGGLVIGTKLSYGKYHQRPTKSGRPPQRRFLFLLRNASETLGRLLHAYSVDQAKKAGLRTRAAIQAGAEA
ncbi:MAG: hypothetical protein ABI634_14045 [Acidobacteriota bacterium]